jgi:GT2 family glycosyltransferase
VHAIRGDKMRKRSKRDSERVGLPWYLRGDLRQEALLRLIRQSDFFDHQFYASQRSDIPGGFEEAWSHFLNFGWKEHCNPSEYFDVDYYLNQNQDVRDHGSNPLIHWYLHGRLEGRFPFDPFGYREIMRSGLSSGLTKKRIAVCIPVFNGFEFSVRCINSVIDTLKQSKHDVIIHVHDDHSSDLELLKFLSQLSQDDVVLTCSNENLGFTKSANHMLMAHPDRDVVLLNSDTVVFGKWLDNLCETAYSSRRVASVSAMSNNSTITSFPNWPVGQQIEVDDAQLISEKLSENNALDFYGLPTLPTAVGSCMYLRRDAIDAVGYLDEERYPRGYGEENQWSMRCQLQGWIHVAALNTFVLHEGGASFGRETGRLKMSGAQQLLKEFPEYESGITRWVQNSGFPRITQSRNFIWWDRPSKVSAVHIVHDFGGGTDKVVRTFAIEDVSLWEKNALILRQKGDFFSITSVGMFRDDPTVGVPFQIGRHELLDFLSSLDIASRSIVVHDPLLVDPESIRQMRKNGYVTNLYLHDYRSVCQRGFKVLPNGLPCKGPNANICDRCLCLKSLDLNSETERIDDGFNWFISKSRQIASEYDRVLAPSVSAATELASILDLQISLFSIDGKAELSQEIEVPISSIFDNSDGNSVIRVAIIGRLGPHKGTRIISDLVDYAYVNHPEFVFNLVGTWDDVRDAPPMMIHRGEYLDEESLRKIVEQIEVDLFLIASPAAETFCLTLSDVLAVRNHETPVVIPEGNIWDERTSGHDNIVQFDCLGGVAGIISALKRAGRAETGIIS